MKNSANSEKRRVLIVDDEKWICESLGMILSRHGLKIDSASTGREALRRLERGEADLLILDFSLPDIDGLEVLSELRKMDMEVPVIFMTGYGSETVSIKAFKLGIADYFIKPFHPKLLEDKVVEILAVNKKRVSVFPFDLPMPDDLEPEIETSSGVGRAVRYLKDNYSSRVSLDEISKMAGFSRYHFTRSFKKVMGISFTEYLNHLRVKKAKEALSDHDINISEVAFKVGFSSLRQFERAFKGTSGKTPGEFRREKYPKISL